MKLRGSDLFHPKPMKLMCPVALLRHVVVITVDTFIFLTDSKCAFVFNYLSVSDVCVCKSSLMQRFNFLLHTIKIKYWYLQLINTFYAYQGLFKLATTPGD